MLNHQDIDSLLLKYLLQETTPAENESVEKWLKEQPEHTHYFRQFQKCHLHLQAALQSEQIQGRYPEFARKMHRRTILRRLSRIAAILLLILGSGLCLYLLRSPEQTEALSLAETTIHPGSSQAILHLSSGQSIPVHTTSRQLQEEDGTIIRISDQGSLNYSQAANETGSDLINRLEIPRGGEFKIRLADGTEIWLNAESELQYPTAFSSAERTVRLRGEAYFKVAKDPDRPFLVEVGAIKIKVYGTQFNINTQYRDHIETVLVSGSVSIEHQGQETRLQPSQKAEYRSSGELIIEEVNPLPYIAWKDGNFLFQNESLETIMEKLSRWYDLEIFYVNEEVKKIRLSGMLERYKNAEELFQHFEKISKARFSTRGNTVTVQ